MSWMPTLFTTAPKEAPLPPQLTEKQLAYDKHKDNLITSLNSLDTHIKNISNKVISHNAAISLLKKASTTYTKKFIPFHTAAYKILSKSKTAENEFKEMKGRLEKQFKSVSKIWETHKGQRSLHDSAIYKFTDNKTKKLFKRNLALLQKTNIYSKVSSKSDSYQHSSGPTLSEILADHEQIFVNYFLI